MRVRQVLPLALTVGLLALISFAPLPQGCASACRGATTASGQLPISFEVNQGQVESQVRFLAHGPGYGLFLTPQEALLALHASKSGQPPSSSPLTLVGMQFLHANPQPAVMGAQPLPGVVNYLLGNNPANWRTDIPTYGQVQYRNLYSGIDLLYYGSQGHLEYDFIVAPGSNPAQIHLGFVGPRALSLDDQGELVLHLPGGDLVEGAPYAYQEINGTQQEVASRYVLQGAAQVGFTLGDYDASQPLIIDPQVLFSTYLGGFDNDNNTALARDSAGNAYISGTTFSTNFPTQNALQPAFGGGPDDAFVAELNASGTALVYSTYLGGSGADWGTGIAIDGAGDAFVTGGTSSTNFPTLNPLQATNAGTANAFVAALKTTGTGLIYATYLGGSNYDFGSGIAVDSAGNAYVTGSTHSSNFPAHAPLQSSSAGNYDAFVAKLNPAGTALVYSTYLGGSGNDSGAAIAVDSAGSAYITGSTSSTNFPTKNPLQPASAGAADAFIAKVNAAGTALVYSTYLGGSNPDSAASIALDTAGNAYITGFTSSTNFPTRTPLQATNAGGADAFVVSLSATGSALWYSGYLGGSSNDMGNGIAVDGADDVYVVGSTASANFPTATPLQAYGGMQDGFVTKLNLTGPAQFQVSQSVISLITTPGTSPGQQTLALSNLGFTTLNWSANSLPSWVSVSPSSGSLPTGNTQLLTLTFNTPGTTPQAYTTTLVLSDPSAANSPVSIPITVVSANVSKTWYFAEGYTGGSFTTWLTLANPNASATTVTVTYLLQGTAPIVRTYQVGANARATINVNSVIGNNQNVSMVVTGSQPIIAERPMYFTYTGLSGLAIPGGSDVLGATSLSQQFDFGYLDTTSGHDTWLTILNQNSGSMTVTINYYPQAGGSPIQRVHTVPGNSRGTVHVNTDGLPAGSYSALVSLSASGLAERPLYLRDQATGYTGSADVVGVAQPQQNWYFAEGYVSSTFSERYIVSNPSTSTSATVTFTFFQGGGQPKTTQLTLAPGQQKVLNVGSLLQGNNSAQINATSPILAERFISFKYTGPVGGSSSASIPGASDVLGAATPSNLFYFAEGYTGGGFAEYLTIENPDPTNTATVVVTFLPSNGGATTVQMYTIPPGTRFTLFTNGVMGNQSFSMVVESNVAIVAERPMYFAYNGSQTGGSDVVGYQP